MEVRQKRFHSADRRTEETARSKRKVPTGIDVDFGQDGSDKETILVDFEGGRVHHEPRIDDNCRLEVVMLAPTASCWPATVPMTPKTLTRKIAVRR